MSPLTHPDAGLERREEDVVADLGVGVLDGDGVGGHHDGGGEVDDAPPVVGCVVPRNAEIANWVNWSGTRKQSGGEPPVFRKANWWR